MNTDAPHAYGMPSCLKQFQVHMAQHQCRPGQGRTLTEPNVFSLLGFTLCLEPRSMRPLASSLNLCLFPSLQVKGWKMLPQEGVLKHSRVYCRVELATPWTKFMLGVTVIVYKGARGQAIGKVILLAESCFKSEPCSDHISTL